MTSFGFEAMGNLSGSLQKNIEQMGESLGVTLNHAPTVTIEGGIKRYHDLCMEGIQAWDDGMSATSRMTQGVLKKLRVHTTEAAPKKKKS